MIDKLNTTESELILYLKNKDFVSQRDLSLNTGYSLGAINQALKALKDKNYLDNTFHLTSKASGKLERLSPKTGVILAAGLGLRMVPINNSVSKGLLEVKGEPLVERIIKQLYEVGITEIYIVVGFMKEQYEYLIDKYNVRLIVNRDYATKNNIYSLSLAIKNISNAYIVPCDVWCENNPFRKNEMYSWYMVSDELSSKSYVKVNRKNQLVTIENKIDCNKMIGIGYLIDEDLKTLYKNICSLLENEINNNLFWEDALKDKEKFFIQARLVNHKKYFEIDTYEQLRALDSDSNQLKSAELELISNIFKVDTKEITDISALKKGMTNRSFIFRIGRQKYIMRIPGEGTDKLINRKQEAGVYNLIKDKNICDDIILINADNGYKISAYFSDARCCNPDSIEDITECMKFLKSFHNLNLYIDHEFDLFGQIEFYENLRGSNPSLYRDYKDTKENVLRLKSFIDAQQFTKCLTHIDAVCDNFLFVKNADSKAIKLIDWEYAGMQDPHLDIAMFVIYACYDEEMIDKTIDIYFEHNCTEQLRYKIYAYIAIAGLLWSNWCEYKFALGVEFGEYSLKQYRYAKTYSKKVIEYMERLNG